MLKFQAPLHSRETCLVASWHQSDCIRMAAKERNLILGTSKKICQEKNYGSNRTKTPGNVQEHLRQFFVPGDIKTPLKDPFE